MPSPVFSSPLPHHAARRQWLRAASALALSGAARAQPSDGKPEKPRVTMALGGKASLYHLPITIAEQLGYFSDEGLDVELRDHAGGSLARQSLLSGGADVVAGGFEHTIVLRQRGHTCLAFAILGRAPQLVFGVNARLLPERRSLALLRGRRVGVSAPDSSTHWFARMLLARDGLSDTDVEYVGVGTSTAVVNAVREGRVDAIASIDPVISLLELHGDIRVLADTRSLRGTQALYGGPMPGGCLYAPRVFVLRHPQTVQALTNATVRALKWLRTAGPSDIVRTVPASYMHGDRAIYLAALDKAREALSPDGLMADEGAHTAYRMMVQFSPGGAALHDRTLGATYTNDFARRAKQRFQAYGLFAGAASG